MTTKRLPTLFRTWLRFALPATTLGLLLTAVPAFAVAPDVPPPPAQQKPLPKIEIAKTLGSSFLYDKAPFPSCHAGTIAELPDGTLVASFFGGTAERNPDVCIWVTRKEKGAAAWGDLIKVADGVVKDPQSQDPPAPDKANNRYPTWNPVLFQPKTGPLLLFYKIGPSPSTWWGMMTTSEDGGKTWSKPQRLPQGVLGPIKNKPVQLADGTILSGSSVEGDGGWRLHVESSSDNGKTWTRGPDLPNAQFKAIQPSILFHGNRLQMLCRSQQNVLVETWSDDNGKTWSPLAATSLPNPNSGTDAVTLQDGRQLLVYNPTKREDPIKGRTPLHVAVSSDGKTWKDVLTLENDYVGQYSYPAVIQGKDGTIHTVYTYHRKNMKHVMIDPKSF
jgi:predicted neuraminidase